MKNIGLAWLALVIFVGCSAERAASRKLMRADRQSKYAVAEWCARLYPPVALVKDSISYLRGKAELVYVSVDCDTVPINNTSGRVITVPCPESKVVDTVFLYRERHLVNNALVKNLESELAISISRYNNIVKYRNVLLVVVSICFLYFIVKILRGISFKI